MSSKLDALMVVYEKHLRACMAEQPDNYPILCYGEEGIQKTLSNMRGAIARGSYNRDATALKRTCRELGVKYTYAAVAAYLKE